jgi:mono/diheme cytochrome c family protein
MLKRTVLLLLFSAVNLLGIGAVVAADGEQLFRFYCAQCHGPEGKGNGPNVTEDFATDPRDFTNAEEMQKLSDADIKSVVLDGGPAVSKSALMPPWSKTISEADVVELTKILRQFCNCEGP